ncbi:MAG: aminotransferase class V-fold PLP-dependent enzyme, partial [Clostridia bacterium]|nr:aminotransferase class V-fold PLP-dependent enzyme [Clostridia bacterium]
MDESILERLKKNSADGRLPMHMPGHKRNPQFEHLTPLGGTLDITEIDGFDDLNSPDGIFLESERLAASLWGSSECLYSVNGSSGAILAGVRAVVKDGGRLLMARGCHKSVYHAAELTGASAVYFEAELTSYGFLSGISPDEVEKKLSEYPDTKLVIITSPTYEGVISDVRSIADVCHRYNVPLMVDEAHGAHLGLHGIFPDGAVKCGADIVVQSIHKTLPSL